MLTQAVGICGSDVHYWTAGRGARFAVEDKMVLGHEGAGEIIEVGAKVENVTVGDRVAFEPGFATQEDDLTKNGRYNLSKVFFCATPRGAMRFRRPKQRNSNPVGVDVLWTLGVWQAPPLRGLA